MVDNRKQALREKYLTIAKTITRHNKDRDGIEQWKAPRSRYLISQLLPRCG